MMLPTTCPKGKPCASASGAVTDFAPESRNSACRAEKRRRAVRARNSRL